MKSGVISTEVIFTSVASKRVLEIAAKCLVELRLIENRRIGSNWLDEYEVSGEVGKVEKFAKMLESIELK